MACRALRTAVAHERMAFRSCTDRPARGRLTPTLWREKLTSATYSMVPPPPVPPACTHVAAWLMASARAFSTGARRSHASGAVVFEPRSWQVSTRGSERATAEGPPASGAKAPSASPPSPIAPSAAVPDAEAAAVSSAEASTLRGRRHMYRPLATRTSPSRSAAPSCKRPGPSSRARPLEAAPLTPTPAPTPTPTPTLEGCGSDGGWDGSRRAGMTGAATYTKAV